MNKKARIAGFLYLGVIIFGIFSLAYVPAQLFDFDNAAANFTNIQNNETLFRLSLVSGLICYTFFVFLPLALYVLLRSVNENHARLMVILALISVPISFLNIQNKFAILPLLDSESYLSVFSIEQLHAQVLFLLNQYNDGILIVQIFWGLWLFPFGYLVYKSDFLPKLLGIFLMVGCFGYLFNFFGYALFPKYGELGIASYIGLPATIGEIGSGLWLTIMGVRQRAAAE